MSDFFYPISPDVLSACKKGDIVAVRRFLRSKEFDPSDSAINEGLMAAANNGHPQIVALMYKHGVLFAKANSPRNSLNAKRGVNSSFKNLASQLRETSDALEQKKQQYDELMKRFQQQEAEYIASKMELINMVDKVNDLEMQNMNLQKSNAELAKLVPKSKLSRMSSVSTVTR